MNDSTITSSSSTEQLMAASSSSVRRNEQQRLMCAAMIGNDTEVESILKSNATMNVNCESVDYQGHTPLLAASLKGYAKIVQLLLNHSKNTNGNNPNIINLKSRDGQTPLHLACYQGNLIVVQMLVHNGADIDAVDNDGHIAEDYALVKKNYEIVKYMLQERQYRTRCRSNMWLVNHWMNQ